MFLVIVKSKYGYELATRTVFRSEEAGNLYASTLPEDKKPIVVSGRFDSLRFGEDRGTFGYWLSTGLKPRKKEPEITRPDLPAMLSKTPG